MAHDKTSCCFGGLSFAKFVAYRWIVFYWMVLVHCFFFLLGEYRASNGNYLDGLQRITHLTTLVLLEQLKFCESRGLY